MKLDLKELQEKAKNGDGLSAYILGRSYYSSENGIANDYQKSYNWYKFGYEKLGDPRCMYGYAMFYYDDGESEDEGIVKKDNDFANMLFKQVYPKLVELSKQGDMYSTFVLAVYYHYGIGGMKKSSEQKLAYIKQAATQGHPGALFDLGKFYELGNIVEKDLTKSIEYYSQAATLGNLRAKNKLTELTTKK